MKKISSHLSIAGIMLALSCVLLSCGGKSGGGDAAAAAPGGSEAPAGGQMTISGTVQPDPNDPSASGKNAGASVFVVGQQNSATTTDSSGNYTLSVDPKLSGSVTAAPKLLAPLLGMFKSTQQAPAGAVSYGLIVISGDQGFGRKTEVLLAEGQANTSPAIYINTVGSISGKVRLQNQTDHTGINVYIPGTSFMAMTAADGSFTISNVPSGTYDVLRAEKSGYRYSVLSGIAVKSNAATLAADQLLLLSAGAAGQILVANGAAISTSRTVKFTVAATDDAVLMMTSDNAFFSNTSWQPIQSTTSYTFTSDGEKTLWIKFADANGLESAAFSSSKIFVDSNPLVTLVAPAPSAAISETTPVFSWRPNPAVPAGTYHIQLSPSGNFSSVLAEAVVSSTSYTLPVEKKLANNGEYYCRIAIVDNGVEWNWSGPWPFTVDLGRVTLLGPVPFAQTDTKPAFSWSGSTVANSAYRLQVARDAAFTNVFEDSAITSPSLAATNYTLLNSLSNNKVYYWRVAVIDANGVQGAWTQAQPFTVNLGSVTLFTPSGITNDSKPTLAWADSPLAGATYRVQLTNSNDSTFSSPQVNAVVTSAAYAPAAGLANGGYQWRVAVIDANGHTGSYSSPLSFSVDIGSVVPASPSGAVPYSRPSFAWSASAIANAKYRIQISRNSGFTDLQEDSITGTPSGLTSPAYTPVNLLQNASTYYWRVQVVDPNGTTGAWSAVQSFATDLGTVVLISPADGAFVANTTSDLDWSDSTIPGAKTYDVQLAADAAFTALLVDQTGLASSHYTIGTNAEAALTNGQAFFWRVRVRDANGVAGLWATSGKPFTVNLGTVNIVGPSGMVSDTKPVVTWTASSLTGAKYWLQVSDDAGNWATNLVVNTTVTSATSFPIPAALANNTTYYVRVAVVDANNVPGDWAGPQTFTVNVGTIALQGPADLATLSNTRPTLDWSDSTLGPNAKYHVQVATDTGFSAIVEQSDTAVNTSTYALSAGLPNGLTYYWRVAVIDGNNVMGAYTAFRQFTIDLGTVALLAPAGGTSDTRPTLDWSDSALQGASYRVQLSTDTGFATKIVNKTTAAGVSQNTVSSTTLTNGTTYYWRVAVIDAYGIQGGWSSTQTFVVDLGTVSLSSPMGATTGQTTPTFSWFASSLPSVKYHIQVANNTGFNPTLADATNLVPATYTLLAANALNDLTAYYWRVSVIDQNGVEGSFCPYASFNVNIGTVVLGSPSSVSNTNDTTPAFNWSSNANASTYTLTLSTNADLSGGANYGGLAGTSYTLTALNELPATGSTVWYWAITPVDTNGVSGTRSSVWSFTLDTVAPTGNSVTGGTGITVNGGASATSSETVNLTLSASDAGGTGVSQMWVSTNSGFSDGAWEAYSASKQFTFASMTAQNTGTMTAYVKYADAAGNVSGTYSDSINLARTTVTADITTNATWTNTTVPYVIKNNILISTGVTLTINPGAVIKVDPGAYILVAGTMIANGAGSPITFTSNKIAPKRGDWGSIKFTGDDALYDGGGNYLGGSILQNCIIEYAGSSSFAAVTLDGGEPFINKCVIRHNQLSGIRVSRWGSSAPIRITNNVIYDNGSSGYDSNSFGGGIMIYPTLYSGYGPRVENNVICGNTVYFDGGGIYGNSRIAVANNTICNNTAMSGGGARFDHFIDTTGNTIVNNVSTSGKTVFYQYYDSLAPSGFSSNNIFRNAAEYELWFIDQGGYQAGGTFNALNNYWGTTVDAEVQQKIFDWHDAGCSTCGIITYAPIATAPSITAPISPPAGLAATPGAGSIDVNWSANPESDTAGYKVYWGTASGHPYANSANVTVGTSTTLTGLVPGTTYFVTVTAYDAAYSAANDDPTTAVNENQTNGNESWYAPEMQAIVQ